jgi:hypothetical protein
MRTKQWKLWVIFLTGLVVMIRGFIGDPPWYIAIGIVIAVLALWSALEKNGDVTTNTVQGIRVG